MREGLAGANSAVYGCGSTGSRRTPPAMITIDGSIGEGGGQILRTALALSMTTGAPFCMEKIRAGRAKPGLLRQHLTAVKAAATISNAAVDGAELGAQRITFRP